MDLEVVEYNLKTIKEQMELAQCEDPYGSGLDYALILLSETIEMVEEALDEEC